MVFETARRMSASFPPALASEMAGIRSTETELVMTDGNMMTDIAMPVKMP